MSSSEAEDEFQEPATPTATQAGEALPLLPQQVRAPGLPAPPGGPGAAAPTAQIRRDFLVSLPARCRSR